MNLIINRKSLVIGAFLCSFGLRAETSLDTQKSVKAFQERFTLVRNPKTKELISIREKKMDSAIGLERFVLAVVKELMSEPIFSLSSSGANVSVEEQVDEFVFNDLEIDTQNVFTRDSSQMTDEELKGRIVDSIKATKNVDFNKMTNQKSFKEVMKGYETKLNSYFSSFDFNVVAVPSDPLFFYRGTVATSAVKFGIDLAKKSLSEIPVLNTAIYIIFRYEALVRERRQYHQNILLHYLEKLDEKDLGLTQKERIHLISSIYEARIPALGYADSKKAKATWDSYGVNIFYAQLRAANTNYRKYATEYKDLGKRHNFAFVDSTYKGQKVIVNMFDQQHMFTKRPAIAFYYQNPNKIKRMRQLLRLSQIGLSFIPVNDFIKDNVNKFVDSIYRSQIMTEGALAGHFETGGDSLMKKQIITQSINPFIPSEL